MNQGIYNIGVSQGRGREKELWQHSSMLIHAKIWTKDLVQQKQAGMFKKF